MNGDLRIVFEEDGFPRELVTAAERERAIRDELITAETEVTLYRTGIAPKVTRAGDIAELQSLFKVDEPEPAPAPDLPPPPLGQRASGSKSNEVAAPAPLPAEPAADPFAPALEWEVAEAEDDGGHVTPGTSFSPGGAKVMGFVTVGVLLVLLIVIGLASGRRTSAGNYQAANAVGTLPVDSGTTTAAPEPTGPASVTSEEMAASLIRYTIRETNVRAGPHRERGIIAVLARGEMIQGVSVPSLSDPNHRWLKITHGPNAGYFAAESNLSANARPALDTSVTGQWTVYQSASVYAEPSTGSAVLATASPNQSFTVFGLTTGGMMEVSREGGGIGYIERSAFDQPVESESGNSASVEGYDELSMWEHNGGLLRLRASGQGRVFVYSRPRAGVPAAPGDVLFRGERRGFSYRGTAYLFSTQCGRIGFPVDGNVGPDDRQVALRGNAPLRDRNCRVIGNRPEQLLFRYVRNQ